MSEIAIRVESLGKRYKIGSGQSYDRFSEVLQTAHKTIFSAFRKKLRSSQSEQTQDFWALRDVSFDVREGEVLGVIGRNGAGKSTLLKLLSRITEPTEGRFGVKGQVGSLLEVGTGFHPELTGRENIYLSGTILGMSRAEIRAHFDEIVEFAEISQFLDTPVKRYSSGMYVRLGFAIAAHLKPEILIVDEVLAVGDIRFQRKCLGKMEEVAQQGRTILFVSHNIQAIRSLSHRSIWLNSGQIERYGPTEETTSAYLKEMFSLPEDLAEQGGFALRKVELFNQHGAETNEFRHGDRLRIRMKYRCSRLISSPHFIVVIHSAHGPVLAANMLLDGRCPEQIDGEGELECTFLNLPLLPQSFSVSLGVRHVSTNSAVYSQDNIAEFFVSGVLSDYDLHGEVGDMLMERSLPVTTPYEWKLPDGRILPVNFNPNEN